MTASLLTDALALIETAQAAYRDDPAALEELTRWRVRMADPVRIGIAGMVKAGKSTLLNALIGERIAPTDAGECTRVVTWYRYGDVPGADAQLRDGTTRRLLLRRRDDGLSYELDDLDLDDIVRIDVRWPSVSLRATVLIDTPGIESATSGVSERTHTLLIRDRVGPDDADALVYLMRHLHPSDVSFLESFRDTGAGPASCVSTVAILSRADEVGAGRLDAMLSARKIAERYRTEPALRPLALTVLPIAGLIAETARTLREREYAAVATVAALTRPDRERLLLSVDRLVRGEGLGLSGADRRMLVERFGLSGIRLASALVRGGAAGSPQLSEQLLRQSGLDELRTTIRRRFRPRSAALKVRALLAGLDQLAIGRVPSPALVAASERLAASAHELRELDLLARVRSEPSPLPLPSEVIAEAERVLGADGTGPSERLGLPAAAPPEELVARADELIAQWRRRSVSPLAARPTVRACADIVRSLEGARADVAAGSAADSASGSEVAGVSAGGPPPDVDTAGGPADGVRQDAHQQGERPEPGLHKQDQRQRRQRRARLAELEAEREDEAQHQQ